jgi:ubiquinone biosynthesis protein COQ9
MQLRSEEPSLDKKILEQALKHVNKCGWKKEALVQAAQVREKKKRENFHFLLNQHFL